MSSSTYTTVLRYLRLLFSIKKFFFSEVGIIYSIIGGIDSWRKYQRGIVREGIVRKGIIRGGNCPWGEITGGE